MSLFNFSIFDIFKPLGQWVMASDGNMVFVVTGNPPKPTHYTVTIGDKNGVKTYDVKVEIDSSGIIHITVLLI